MQFKSGHGLSAGSPSLLPSGGLILPRASPHTLHGHMDKNLYAGTAEDEAPVKGHESEGGLTQELRLVRLVPLAPPKPVLTQP